MKEGRSGTYLWVNCIYYINKYTNVVRWGRWQHSGMSFGLNGNHWGWGEGRPQLRFCKYPLPCFRYFLKAPQLIFSWPKLVKGKENERALNIKGKALRGEGDAFSGDPRFNFLPGSRQKAEQVPFPLRGTAPIGWSSVFCATFIFFNQDVDGLRPRFIFPTWNVDAIQTRLIQFRIPR